MLRQEVFEHFLDGLVQFQGYRENLTPSFKSFS